MGMANWCHWILYQVVWENFYMILGKPDICVIPHWLLMFMMYSLFPFTRGHPVDIGWFYFTMISRLMSTEGLFTAWLAAPLVIVWNLLGRDDPLPNKQQSERIPGLRSCAVHSSAIPWWRHQTEAFSSLMALCAGNSPATGEFPAQRTSNADFDVGPHTLLNKQSNERWFDTTWRSYGVIAMTVDMSHGLGKITHLQSASVVLADRLLLMEKLWLSAYHRSPHMCASLYRVLFETIKSDFTW